MTKATIRPAAPAGDTRTTGAEPGILALLTLLGVTLIGTVCNNVVNVPLRDLSDDLDVPLPSGVLAVSAFVLVLAATMPVMGWVGDRFGRKRTLVAAQVLLLLGMAGAALAPSLPVLVAARALQGLGCAAAPPCVMGMLASLYGPARRSRTMGLWAAANGIGQALGPPMGGFVAGFWGWRGIFWLLVPVSALLVAALAWLVPGEAPRRSRLDWPGAVAFTTGIALLMTAAALAPDDALPGWILAALAGAGAAALAAFALVSRRARDPFVPPALLVEPRFLRSGLAACAQMFCLGATLVALPLHLTGALGRSTGAAGALVFALPATMAVLAAAVGRLAERFRPRLVLRTGLVTLALAQAGLGLFTEAGGTALGWLCALLVTTGAGVALVQTPAAAGATRSAEGRAGAALGVFNTLRFGGATLGTAWAGLLYPQDLPAVLFGGCAIFALFALLTSFAGRDPGSA